jgi:hypothetical protein
MSTEVKKALLKRRKLDHSKETSPDVTLQVSTSESYLAKSKGEEVQILLSHFKLDCSLLS